MQQSQEIDKIVTALVEARKSMGAVEKSGRNEYDRYNYATLLDYIQATENMVKYGLSVIASVDSCEPLGDRPTKKGSIEYAYQVSLTLRVVHVSGQWIECHAFGHGQDRADKGVYQAITGARKYAIASIFSLATSDDPDANQRLGAAPQPQSRREAPSNEKGKRPNASKLAALVGEWAGVNAEDVPAAVRDIAKAVGLKISAPITEAEAASLTKLISGAANDGQSFIDVVNAKGGD